MVVFDKAFPVARVLILSAAPPVTAYTVSADRVPPPVTVHVPLAVADSISFKRSPPFTGLSISRYLVPSSSSIESVPSSTAFRKSKSF